MTEKINNCAIDNRRVFIVFKDPCDDAFLDPARNFHVYGAVDRETLQRLTHITDMFEGTSCNICRDALVGGILAKTLVGGDKREVRRAMKRRLLAFAEGLKDSSKDKPMKNIRIPNNLIEAACR
jgi:hypothetical protein